MRCRTCDKEIDGPFQAVSSYVYHNGCIRCDGCKRKIVGDEVGFLKGEVLCPKCSDAAQLKLREEWEAKVNKCVVCGLPAKEYVLLNERRYHSKCLLCTDCRKPVGDQACMVGGDVFCAECGEVATDAENKVQEAPAKSPEDKEICSVCHKAVTGSVVRAMSASFCVGCFVCGGKSRTGGGCGKPFKTSSFVNVGGVPFHEPCARRRGSVGSAGGSTNAGGSGSRGGKGGGRGRPANRRASIGNAPETSKAPASGETCGRCKRLVLSTESSVVAESTRWHTDCFRCFLCNELIEGGKYAVLRSKPACVSCAEDPKNSSTTPALPKVPATRREQAQTASPKQPRRAGPASPKITAAASSPRSASGSPRAPRRLVAGTSPKAAGSPRSPGTSNRNTSSPRARPGGK